MHPPQAGEEIIMTDPLSLVALGAAVGGMAGKLAERTWDSAEEWLRDRFAHHAENAKAAARENAARFLIELANRIKVLEDQHEVEASLAEARESHPQFSAMLQLAVLAAAQTEDPHKHQLLADLVAARLTTNSETTLALASEMACHAVARLTNRQLRLLGLCSFIERVRPRHPVPPGTHGAWLDAILTPFDDIEFVEIDALHLVAVNCATYNPASEKDLIFWLNLKVGAGADDSVFSDSTCLAWLEIMWGQGLAGVQLTSVGSLVGGFVFDHLTGAMTGIPEWD